MATSVPLHKSVLFYLQWIALRMSELRKLAPEVLRMTFLGHRWKVFAVLVAGALGYVAYIHVGAKPREPLAPLFGSTDEMVVLVRNSPTTRFIGADGAYAGLEEDLLQLFASDMRMRLKIVERSEPSDILPALERGVAHFAAAGLSISPERKKRFQFGPSYFSVRKTVAYRTDDRPPRIIGDLIGKRVAVIEGSNGAEQLAAELKTTPTLQWQSITAHDPLTLIERLANGEFDNVVSDSHVLALARNFYPMTARAFDLGAPVELAWAFPKNVNPLLVNQAHEFFRRIRANGTLRALQERYFGHVERLNRYDVLNFLQRRSTVLPRYRAMFVEAQELTGIDWRLIAALGFQESHWDPLATSPTGVRGLMMLTSETADRMGVTDRLDAHQNILAGARYLSMLKDSLPGQIRDPDRTWMSLAAYNIGYGHLEDARVLAQRERLNPNSWSDLKIALPLLARSDYYTTVKRGFARGGEAVVLTENIRNFYDILLRYEKPHKPLFDDFLEPEPEPDLSVPIMP
jgi:membrane-bound lytic murein transglycosylase F